MKNISSILAILVVVGGVGISQAFACKAPAQGLVTQKAMFLKARAVEPEPATSAAAEARYNLRDLNGGYSSFATATLFDGSRTQYATCVGLIVFDGRGHFVDKEAHSYDGALVNDQFTGTYEVHSDGTGVMHYVGDSESYDVNFVISNNGNKITFLIMLDVPGLVSWGTMEKQ